MAEYTVINDLFDNAPKRRVLKGNKKAKPEAAEHIIEFPGGAIEVARLDDGTYWAHIIVNRAYAIETLMPGLKGATGIVVESRIDWGERSLDTIPSLPDGSNLTQIAVRIRPEAANG